MKLVCSCLNGKEHCVCIYSPTNVVAGNRRTCKLSPASGQLSNVRQKNQNLGYYSSALPVFAFVTNKVGYNQNNLGYHSSALPVFALVTNKVGYIWNNLGYYSSALPVFALVTNKVGYNQNNLGYYSSTLPVFALVTNKVGYTHSLTILSKVVAGRVLYC